MLKHTYSDEKGNKPPKSSIKRQFSAPSSSMDINEIILSPDTEG
jgi:hypothetical protein